MKPMAMRSRVTSPGRRRPDGLPLACGALACLATIAVLPGRPMAAAPVLAVITAKAAVWRGFHARAERTLAALGLDPATGTPVTRRLRRLRLLALLGLLGLGGLLVDWDLLRDPSPDALHVAGLTLLVAGAPVELPTAAAALLAGGLLGMARRDAVVRRPAAVETMAATTVICTRQAGPLTQGEATVRIIVAGGLEYRATGIGYAPGGELRSADVVAGDGNAALTECLLAGLACNDARLTGGAGRWRVIGDPVGGALAASAAAFGLPEAPPRVATLPFAADRRYSATLHRSDAAGTVYVQGSVERVLYLCRAQLDGDGHPREPDRDGVIATARRLGRRGLHVVAFARGQVGPDTVALTEETLPPLVFLGLQALHRPPRPNAAEAVRACGAAGVAVKVITDEDPVTARAAAAWIGLDGGPPMTGAELAALPPREVPDAVERTSVFARVSPAEELMIVKALRARGHVVTRVDGPACRDSAVVRVGTAPDADGVDLVITDGDFASVVAALREERRTLGRLAKVVAAAALGLLNTVIAALVLYAVGERPLVPVLPPDAHPFAGGALSPATAMSPGTTMSLGATMSLGGTVAVLVAAAAGLAVTAWRLRATPPLPGAG